MFSNVSERIHDDDDDDDIWIMTGQNDTSECNDEGTPATLIYIFVAVQIPVCLYGFAGNAILLYKQRNTLLWYNEVALYLGISVANIIASLAHLLAAPLPVLEISLPNLPRALPIFETSVIIVGDVALMAIVFTIISLTFVSFFEIRRFFVLSFVHEPLNKKILTSIFFVVWVLAVVFGLLGFGVHDEQGLAKLPSAVVLFGHYGVVTALQLLVGLALFRIRCYNHKLQTDFAVKRSQQNLEFRTLLNRVYERTKIIMPLFAANVVLWVVLLTIDVLMDQVTRQAHEHHRADCAFQDDIWDLLSDFASSLYCALYPILLSRKSGSTGKQIKTIFCCKYDMSHDISTSPVKYFTATTNIINHENANRQRPNRASAHWLAIERQWERAEPYMFRNFSSSPQRGDRSVSSSRCSDSVAPRP